MVTSTNLSSASSVLTQGAETYERKNAEYGDNFRNFPAAMIGLFPNGLTVATYEDWMRIQFLVLKVVKLTRYAQHFHNGGHKDSIHDDMVYSAMLESIDEELSAYRNSAPRDENVG